MSNELSTGDVLKLINDLDGSKEREKIKLKVQFFHNFVKWDEEEYIEYNRLLDNLYSIRTQATKKRKGVLDDGIVTKSIGDALEEIVTFIFENSFFYKVHPNKRTSVNEIDQFIVLTDEGLQALYEYGFSCTLLMNSTKCFLCECKNYTKTIGSTWVGKFNTLLDVSGGCELGLIFSYEGLSGKETNWYDAHGLTKIIYRISDESKKRFILDININDLERLKDRDYNIFKLIKEKKNALIANVNSQRLYEDTHEGIDEIAAIYEEVVDL